MKKFYLKNKNAGFSLIETIIYIALYGILIGGVVVSMYNMFESSSRNQTKAMVQQEGTYLLGKIDWALTGASTVSVSPTSQQLYINADHVIPSDNPLAFDASGGVLTLKRGTKTSVRLNNTNTTLSNTVFTHTVASGDGLSPESLRVSFTLTTKTPTGMVYSQDFSLVKYLRK